MPTSSRHRNSHICFRPIADTRCSQVRSGSNSELLQEFQCSGLGEFRCLVMELSQLRFHAKSNCYSFGAMPMPSRSNLENGARFSSSADSVERSFPFDLS